MNRQWRGYIPSFTAPKLTFPRLINACSIIKEAKNYSGNLDFTLKCFNNNKYYGTHNHRFIKLPLIEQ